MAKLKALVKSLEDVDEKHRDLYTKTDEGYVLDLDDKDYKAKINEFRNTNLSLVKDQEELEKLRDRFKGVDPDKYKQAVEALDKLKALDEKKLIEAGKVDEVVEARVKSMREDFERQVKAITTARDGVTTERDTLKSRLGELVIDTEVQRAINKIGNPRNGALTDILSRARQTWRIDEEGKMVGRDGGGKQAYNKKGDPLTMDEWAQDLLTSAAHLFEAGTGGGAGGGGSRQGGAGGKKVIPNNPVDIGKNAEAIAKGEAVVQTA